jgi:septum formation protein
VTDPATQFTPTLLLASTSPRRAELLTAAGIRFTVHKVDIDEAPLPDETPQQHVQRLAQEKAAAVAKARPGNVVLGADTVVAVDGAILGKPRDDRDAAAMLRRLSGREHEVFTGIALAVPGRPIAVDVACTRVWFSELSTAEVEWYVRSGEPGDKAGAYAIQGLASRFVERIDGSYSNVVGLPIALVWRLLKDLPEFRREALE